MFKVHLSIASGYKIIKLGVLIFILCLYVAYIPTHISANDSIEDLANILIVNQVRGTECCQGGSLEVFQNQIELARMHHVPVTFSLRYDVLTDPDYLAVINTELDNDLIDWGLFFEVTPQLAHDANVPYSGTTTTWSRAQYAFSLGYTLEQRKRLLETVMRRFATATKTTPTVVSAWMMDAPTAQLLKQDYKVKIMQITREQWGTDSYTLYGGPVHYPYQASSSWLLNPSTKKDGLIVVRQTITDPLWNYGDRFSRFTSQPNDYTQDGKSFEYFKALLNQAVTQPRGQIGWGLIGLENSMEKGYQDIFKQQLKLIAQLRDQRVLQIISSKQLINEKVSNVQLYTGTDLSRGSSAKVAWVTTSTYQVRIRLDENVLFIDDVRLYSDKVVDPYSNEPAHSRGYWIVPPLLDGSRFNQVTDQKKYSEWEKGVISDYDPTNDVSSSPQKIELGTISVIDSANWNSYWSKKNGVISFTDGTKNITFTDKIIELQNWEFEKIQYEQSTSILPIIATRNEQELKLSWTNDKTEAWKLQLICDGVDCQISFSIDPIQVEVARKTYPEFIFPEQLINEVDSKTSKIYLHNQHVVAGKQVARVVFIPRSLNGVSVEIDHPLEFSTNSTLEQLAISPEGLSQPVQFYDFSVLKPGKTTIATNDYELKFSADVYLAPNCRTKILTCVFHPRWLLWYIQAFLDSRGILNEQAESPWLKV